MALCELVSIRKSSRQILLQVPVSRFKSYGNCACSIADSTLWTRLPADIFLNCRLLKITRLLS